VTIDLRLQIDSEPLAARAPARPTSSPRAATGFVIPLIVSSPSTTT
jgi:hypothetical protein